MIKFYNTLTKQKDEFEPLKEGEISFYICGPTAYNYAHIGNLRTYVFEDIVRRTLELVGLKVNEVMNITDVDDKTIKKSGGDKQKLKSLTQKYEKAFLEDMNSLNIEAPENITRATEYIDKMVQFVKDLLEKGIAYKADDGSIYFSIAKFKNYGKLSDLDKAGLKISARVNQDEYKKDNPADFVLWKAWDEQDGDIFWETELGKGRPGWHLECSTMSQDKLGDTFDIHAGAVDLIFPHHENEIAQSEARTGKPLAQFWLHAEHLLVDGKKMAKSANNFYTLADLKEKGFDPLDFRYLCLLAHFKTKLNFTWEALESARDARKRLINIYNNLEQSGGEVSEEDLKSFIEILSDDFDTPRLLAKIWEMLRDEKIQDNKKYQILKYLDKKVLGLGLEQKEMDIPEEIQKLVQSREVARKEKDFIKADELREEIENLGYTVEDSSQGSKIKKK